MFPRLRVPDPVPSVSRLRFQAPAAFESNAAYFSAQEWENLEEWQRELYKNVLRGKNESLISLGKYHFLSQSSAPPGWLCFGDFFPRLGSRFVETRRSRYLLLRAVRHVQSLRLQHSLALGRWLRSPPRHGPLPAVPGASAARRPLPSARGVFPRWDAVGRRRWKPPSPGGPCGGLSLLPSGVLWPMEPVRGAQLSEFFPVDAARPIQAPSLTWRKRQWGQFDAAQKP